MQRRISVADLLRRGAENGKHRRELIDLTGLSDRELRQQVQAERLSGVPILSDVKSGYFLPANAIEVAECVRFLRGMSRETALTADAIEQAYGDGE